MKFIEQFLSDQFLYEPHFQERMKLAVDKAKDIVSASNLSSEQAIIDRMKYIISQNFKIPFHSDYFDSLTFDDLMLEVMLISESNKDSTERSGETIKENKEEATDAFGDLIDEGDEVESLEVPDEFSEEEQGVMDSQTEAFMAGGFAAVR